jgi:hypothetical protein
MYTILPYIVLKPSLLTNLVPPAVVLLPIARAGKVPDTFPSSRTLRSEALHQDS